MPLEADGLEGSARDHRMSVEVQTGEYRLDIDGGDLSDEIIDFELDPDKVPTHDHHTTIPHPTPTKPQTTSDTELPSEGESGAQGDRRIHDVAGRPGLDHQLPLEPGADGVRGRYFAAERISRGFGQADGGAAGA